MMGMDEPLLTAKRGRSIGRVTIAAAVGLCLASAIILSLAWRPSVRWSDFARAGLELRSDWLLRVNYTKTNDFSLPTPSMRCGFVIDQVMKHNSNHSDAMLRAKFRVQSRDVNSFYR
jgi:hypothetical protein